MKEKILNAIAPIIREILSRVLYILFTKLIEKNPQSGKVAIVSLYPIIDVEIEPIIEKTETELDDAVVDAIKEAMEKVAEENGFELPNLDED